MKNKNKKIWDKQQSERRRRDKVSVSSSCFTNIKCLFIYFCIDNTFLIFAIAQSKSFFSMISGGAKRMT